MPWLSEKGLSGTAPDYTGAEEKGPGVTGCGHN